MIFFSISFSASLTFFSKSDLSVSYLVFKTNPLVSKLFTFVANLLYTVFLTTSLFTTRPNLLKSPGIFFNLSTFILSTSVYKLPKFDFSAKLEVSNPFASFKSAFVAQLDKSTLTLIFPPKAFIWLRKVLAHFYITSFFINPTIK